MAFVSRRLSCARYAFSHVRKYDFDAVSFWYHRHPTRRSRQDQDAILFLGAYPELACVATRTTWPMHFRSILTLVRY